MLSVHTVLELQWKDCFRGARQGPLSRLKLLCTCDYSATTLVIVLLEGTNESRIGLSRKGVEDCRNHVGGLRVVTSVRREWQEWFGHGGDREELEQDGEW